MLYIIDSSVRQPVAAFERPISMSALLECCRYHVLVSNVNLALTNRCKQRGSAVGVTVRIGADA